MTRSSWMIVKEKVTGCEFATIVIGLFLTKMFNSSHYKRICAVNKIMIDVTGFHVLVVYYFLCVSGLYYVYFKNKFKIHSLS